jgi:4-aminobutyrate aminotransferase-like enzyme
VEPNTSRPTPSRIRGVLEAAAAAGIVLTKCGDSTIRIAPPLSITNEEATAGVNTLINVLQRVAAATPA